MTCEDFPDTYRAIHRTLGRLRGPARDHVCSCGKPAVDWAYQFTGETLRTSDGSRPHSLDPADYAPMCRACHAQFDLEHDPSFADGRATGARNGQAAIQARPDHIEKMREVSILGGQASWRDPEIAERRRAGQRRAANMRRRCDECSFESNPGGMGTHHKKSGHQGWTRVEEKQDVM